MQEQRGAMGSFSEPLGFEHGSASSDVVNSPSNRLPDYISLNSTSQEGQNASMWTVGEPSSSSGSTHVNQGHSVLSLGDHGSSSSSFSDPFGPSTEPFDLDPHHASRKRKAVELSIGQSSSSSGVGSGSSSVFRTPVDDPTFDPIIPRLGLSIGDHPVHEPAHGNVNLRISSSRQQVEQPFVANDNNRESDVSVLRLTPPSETVLRVPASRRSFQSSRWTRNTSSRPILRDGNELDSISDHPLFAPPSEVTGGDDGGGSGGAASNLSGPSSGVSPSYHSRRLSAFLRRSLLSGTGPDGGERENANIFPRIPPALRSSSSSSSQDVGGLPRQHHQPSSRSSLLLGRQLDGASGFPFHSRSTMTHGSEGRGRLVSEIRSVLELMRRGEPLRFEDLMILDQSIFYGIADIHDRHRDMRLDIDNMSYEELLALEERIGNVNTGLTEETISKHIRQKQYAVETGRPDSEPCCICQEEYKDGDDLGTLECGHEFHHGCIKQWLQHKNLCPICKSAGFETT